MDQKSLHQNFYYAYTEQSLEEQVKVSQVVIGHIGIFSIIMQFLIYYADDEYYKKCIQLKFSQCIILVPPSGHALWDLMHHQIVV